MGKRLTERLFVSDAVLDDDKGCCRWVGDRKEEGWDGLVRLGGFVGADNVVEFVGGFGGGFVDCLFIGVVEWLVYGSWW